MSTGKCRMPHQPLTPTSERAVLNRTLKSEKQNGGWHHWRVVPRPWRLTRVWRVV